MINWLSLVLVRIGAGLVVGGGLVVGQTFTIQRLISEMELFLHRLGQTGS